MSDIEQGEGARRETTCLSVPADPRYARVVRLTAANLASIAGLTVEDVDDVRMAAEEAFVYACATGVRECLEVDFTVGEGQIEMVFSLGEAPVSEDEAEPSLAYAALLLDALCDTCEITDAPQAVMRLTKTKGVADAL